MVQFYAILCVLGIVAGQLLFKFCSSSLSENGLSSPKTLAIFLSVMLLYGITSVGWVLLLQRAPLGKVYPFMALAFILVPFASHFLFGERFGAQYALGVCLIAVGVFVAVKA